MRSLTYHTRQMQPEARQAAQVQLEEPMRYLPVPHTVQTARRAGRPFFIVTCSTSLELVLARHFKQYISTDSGGVAIIEGSCSEGCQDYSQKKPSRRMRLQDQPDRPVIAL